MEENNEIKCPVVEANKKVLGQKDAVFKFFKEAYLDKLGNPTTIEIDADLKYKDVFTKDIKKIVRQKLFDGIRAGEIKCKGTYDDKKLRKYCSGLISNWLAKDKRYN